MIGILERNEQNLSYLDLFSKLLNKRIIFIKEDINPEMASEIIAQLFYLASTPEEEITIYINSPGGDVYDGLAIYDTIQFVKKTCIVKTVCIGCAASMASVLLLGGSKGYRSATPNSTIMLHQPIGGIRGTISDIEINYNEGKRLKELLYKLISENTTITDVYDLLDRDCWLTPTEALDYGIIDKIL